MRNRQRSWPRKSMKHTVKLKNITRRGKKSNKNARKNAYIVKRNVATEKKMISATEMKIVADYMKKVIVTETKRIDVATSKLKERPNSSIQLLLLRLENTL